MVVATVEVLLSRTDVSGSVRCVVLCLLREEQRRTTETCVHVTASCCCIIVAYRVCRYIEVYTKVVNIYIREYACFDAEEQYHQGLCALSRIYAEVCTLSSCKMTLVAPTWICRVSRVCKDAYLPKQVTHFVLFAVGCPLFEDACEFSTLVSYFLRLYTCWCWAESASDTSSRSRLSFHISISCCLCGLCVCGCLRF